MRRFRQRGPEEVARYVNYSNYCMYIILIELEVNEKTNSSETPRHPAQGLEPASRRLGAPDPGLLAAQASRKASKEASFWQNVDGLDEDQVKSNYPQSVTLLAALSPTAALSTLCVEGGVDASLFVYYLDQTCRSPCSYKQTSKRPIFFLFDNVGTDVHADDDHSDDDDGVYNDVDGLLVAKGGHRGLPLLGVATALGWSSRGCHELITSQG